MSWKIVGALACSLVVLGCGSVAEAPHERVGTTQQAVLAADTKRFSISLPRGTAIDSTVLAAARALLLADRSQVQAANGVLLPLANSGTSSGGGTELGVEAQSGAIVSTPPVALRDRARVVGSIQSGGLVTRQNQTVVAGTVTESRAPSFDIWSWTVSFPAASVSVTVPPDSSANLNPGSFESISVFSRSTLRLKTGTYYLKSLDLEPQAQLLVDTTQGPVFIYVRSNLIWRGAATFAGPSDQLLLGYAGAESFALESPFNGTLAAPDATVRLAVGATSHVGAFFAKNLQLDPDVRVTLRPFAGWAGVTFDVVPRFECAQTAPNGTKAASFGYFNPNSRPVTLPIGESNKFSLAPLDRRQPTTFLAGTHPHSFSIGYTGTAPSWQLNGATAGIDTSKVCSNSFEASVTEDATLSSTSPNANFGSATTLEVSSQKGSVVKFDRKAILAARGAGRLVKSARLELTLAGGFAAVDAYPMRQAWDETSATWTCAKDQDSAAVTSRCPMVDRWQLTRRSHTNANPYRPDAGVPGALVAGKLVFDVTESLQQSLSADGGGLGQLGWFLQSPAGVSSTSFSREGGNPAKLIIEAIPFTDTDLVGKQPFGFQVDGTLATTETLPTLDGQPRPLAVLKPSDGAAVKFAENELIVGTDSQTELDAIKARWGATEIASPRTSLPGLAKGHVLRIDTNRASPATLVPNLLEGVNRPEGTQTVSSNAALGLLAAAAEENARGTFIAVNWLAPGADVNLDGINSSLFTDGSPLPAFFGTEPSSNAYDWDHFIIHEVPQAWELLFFSKKLKPVINVALIDAGFANDFQDEAHFTQLICPSGACENPFNCGGGTPCPWHGVHTAGAGFGDPNNKYGGAGPGGGVSDLTLFWGFGDMATTIVSVPALVLGGEDIINFSNAIPVPDYLSYTTYYAEAAMWAARHVGNTLIFAAAGNAKTNVDEKRCYDTFLFGSVCPWEKEVWFPCEGAGVACVGATNYSNKDRDTRYSNYGGSVEYWASGTTIAGADPGRSGDGAQFNITQGTSYSSPFMAGIAALTWAARPNQLNSDDVETCLNAAKFGGPDGRFVDAWFATACGLGNPTNFPPIVEIVQPAEEDVNLQSVGFVTLKATAGDFEDGTLGSISWSDDAGPLGSTGAGQALVYNVGAPGVHTVTAKAFDSKGAEGADTVTFSATPAPPNLKILSPAQNGEEVFSGLPVDLVGRMTNFTSPFGLPPYDTSNWVGYHDNSILFDHLTGSPNQAIFNQVGNGRVTWSMTIDGLTGNAARSFKVVSDGNLHVKITSPFKDTELVDGQLNISLTNNTAATLTAASTSDVHRDVSYDWSITQRSFTGVTTPVISLPGQSVAFTPTGFPCGSTNLEISVTAINSLGQIANDKSHATVFKYCAPK